MSGSGRKKSVDPLNANEQESSNEQSPFKSGSRSVAPDWLAVQDKQGAKLNDSDVEIFDFTGAMDDDEPKDWFTSNGAHIPIENGETQNQAFKETTKERREEEKQEIKTHQNIIDYENNNRNLKYEQGAIFDKDGNILAEIKGDETNLTIPDEQIEKLDGGILTHNHPHNTPISPLDIEGGFVNHNLSELRVVLPNGKNYSIKPNKNYSKELAEEFVKEYKQIRDKSAASFINLCKKELQNNKDNVDLKILLSNNMDNLLKAYTYKQAEQFLEENAEKYGFNYKKE